MVHVNAKVNDGCTLTMDGSEPLVGYMLESFPLANGDYLDFEFCIACGHAWQCAYPASRFEYDLETGGKPAIIMSRKTAKK